MGLEREKVPEVVEHPLTDRYINLVAEGMTSFEAVLQLVGPELSRQDAGKQAMRWDTDPLVQHRIEQKIKVQEALQKDVKQQAVHRLLAIALSDVRTYFTAKGVKPVTEWSKREAQAIKKIKYREMEDPFGNVTRTYDLEWYDPIKAMTALRDIFPEELAELVKDFVDIASIRTLDDAALEDVRRRLLSGEG